MLLRLTSSSFGSLFFTRSSVSSTSVEFGFSSGTGLYCVGLIDPKEQAVARKDEFCFGQMGLDMPVGHQGTARNLRLGTREAEAGCRD